MYIIGDTHGEMSRLAKLMRGIDGEVLCVGDIAIGFTGIGDNPSLSKRFWFIRGNHDKPEAAKKHPQYAVDYGMWRGMFLIGGARSVDKELNNRVEYKDWWRDEELSFMECQECTELYTVAKPKIVISHDCPFSIQEIMKAAAERKDPLCKVFGNPHPYNQTAMMDKLLDIHEPDLWIFGHWHCAISFKIGKTMFRCLDVFETMEIDDSLIEPAPEPGRLPASSLVYGDDACEECEGGLIKGAPCKGCDGSGKKSVTD